jgi:hypothetical protein
MAPIVHDDGIPVLASGPSAVPRGYLPAEHYTRFLSDAARSYRANPSTSRRAARDLPR